MSPAVESKFQADLIKEIKKLLPDSIVMKLDSGYKQGIPDLLILFQNRWATLECKRHSKASHRPNQDWYVNQMDHMSFSRFIYPENRELVLMELTDFMKGQGQNEIQLTPKP